MAKTTNKLLQERFIVEYLAKGGVRSRAAKALNIPYATVMSWFYKDEAFKEKLEEAKCEWEEMLRAALIKRGLEKSDTAAIFLLKSLNPEKYDDAIRQRRFLEEIVSKVKQELPQILIQPQEKLLEPLTVFKPREESNEES